MDPTRDPQKVRSLEEEMANIGLNPQRTLGAMTRGCELLAEGSHPMDLSGLPVGSDDVPRTIAEVGRQLREDFDKPMGGYSAEAIDDVQLEEAFKIVRRIIKTASEKMQAKRAYRTIKSKARRYAKQYYRRAKRKISKGRKRLRKRFGGEAGLARARAGGRKRIQREGMDILLTLREELEQAETAFVETFEETSETTEMPIGPYEEAAIQAGLVLMHIGEIFEDVQPSAAEAMFNLSDAAEDLAETFEETSEITEDQGAQLVSLIEATTKAMKAHEAIGSPSLVLVYEAIEQAEAAMTEGTDEAADNLVEHLFSQGARMPAELCAWVLRVEAKKNDDDEDNDKDNDDECDDAYTRRMAGKPVAGGKGKGRGLGVGQGRGPIGRHREEGEGDDTPNVSAAGE